MSENTGECEELIIHYKGTGTLNQQNCEFEAIQQSDSQITICCDFVDWPQPLNARGITFSGLTNRGITIDAKGLFQRLKAIPFSERKLYRYGLWHLTAGEPDWTKAHSVTFALTNFLYCGNDANSGGRGTCYNKLKLKLDASDIVFQKVDQYYEIYNAVCKGESTEVTCELTIDVDGRSRDELRKMANIICDLLTISQGRRIEWINYRVYNANSTLISTYHESRRTDPRIGFRLINFRQPNLAINYLERGYPAYIRFNMNYPSMLNGVANMIYDTNVSRFALTHALVVFSIVDTLGKKILDKKHLNKNTKPPKHYPIKKKINALKTSYKVRLSTDEIEYFRLSRNSVVHELKFHSNDGLKEFEKCCHIFHRILLRMLDYQSDYFDITLPQQNGYGINHLHPSI